MKKAIVALSGGMDSATVLTYLFDKGYEVIPVWFDYGSKHNAYESNAVKDIMKHYGIGAALEIDLTRVMKDFKSNLLKTGGDIPEGDYDEPTMSLTVVPARNIIFASILAGLAESHGANIVALGIHQGDHAIYPDCREDFYVAMREAIYLGTDKKVELIAPFLNTDKTGILHYGMANGTPYRLTRTCYKDQPVSCGKCGSCNERLDAFKKIGAIDPIEYEVQA